MALAQFAGGATGLFSQKLTISNPSLGIWLEVQYNPEEVRESGSLNWNYHQIAGMSQPLVTFGCGDLRRKSFEVLMDAHASPHPKGHIADELQLIRYLRIPYGKDSKPVVILPTYSGGGGGLFTASLGVSGPRMQPLPAAQSSYIGGVPPVVKLAYGGLVEKAILLNYEFREVFHGTTQASGGKPTRAYVTLEFGILDDYERLFVDYRSHEPGSGGLGVGGAGRAIGIR